MTDDQTIYFLPERFADVDIGDGRVVPDRFRSRRRIEGVGDVELVVDATGGRPRVVDMRITSVDEAGVSGVKLARLTVQRLLEADVTATAAYRSPAAWDALFSGSSPFGAVRDAAIVAARRRVSDDRLAMALEAWDVGGIDEVKKRLLVGERQAWRLLKRAREARQ